MITTARSVPSGIPAADVTDVATGRLESPVSVPASTPVKAEPAKADATKADATKADAPKAEPVSADIKGEPKNDASDEMLTPRTPASPSAINAALANGMLAHADETDDSHAPSLTHPGCGIVPAALAIGVEEKGIQRGEKVLLTAFGSGLNTRFLGFQW
jgi:2-methylcitrate dehydratase PrpD